MANIADAHVIANAQAYAKNSRKGLSTSRTLVAHGMREGEYADVAFSISENLNEVIEAVVDLSEEALRDLNPEEEYDRGYLQAVSDILESIDERIGDDSPEGFDYDADLMQETSENL